MLRLLCLFILAVTACSDGLSMRDGLLGTATGRMGQNANQSDDDVGGGLVIKNGREEAPLGEDHPGHSACESDEILLLVSDETKSLRNAMPLARGEGEGHATLTAKASLATAVTYNPLCENETFLTAVGGGSFGKEGAARLTCSPLTAVGESGGKDEFFYFEAVNDWQD